MVSSRSSANPDFVTTESTEDTEKRNLQPISELGLPRSQAVYPISPSSKPIENSVCSVSSVVKKSRSINHGRPRNLLELTASCSFDLSAEGKEFVCFRAASDFNRYPGCC